MVSFALVVPSAGASSPRASRPLVATPTEIKIPVKPGATITEIQGTVGQLPSTTSSGFPFKLSVGHTANLPLAPYAALEVQVSKTQYQIFIAINNSNSPAIKANAVSVAPRAESTGENTDDFFELFVGGLWDHQVWTQAERDEATCTFLKKQIDSNHAHEYVAIGKPRFPTPPDQIFSSTILADQYCR